jgi:hypothetical protein
MADQEMIERCAKALLKFDQPDRDYLSLNQFGKEHYSDMFKVVAKSMREPTEKMFAAGCFMTTAQTGAVGPDEVWQAMIDAVIND